MPRFRIGLNEDDQDLCQTTVSDKRLGAIEEIVIALSLGDRLDGGYIGPGIRLGYTIGADLLAGGHRRQVFLLQLLGPVDLENLAGEGVVDR